MRKQHSEFLLPESSETRSFQSTCHQERAHTHISGRQLAVTDRKATSCHSGGSGSEIAADSDGGPKQFGASAPTSAAPAMMTLSLRPSVGKTRAPSRRLGVGLWQGVVTGRTSHCLTHTHTHTMHRALSAKTQCIINVGAASPSCTHHCRHQLASEIEQNISALLKIQFEADSCMHWSESKHPSAPAEPSSSSS